MAVWTAELGVWLLGLGTLISVAMVALSRLVRHDSTRYDEVYVWRRTAGESPPRHQA